jgi:hypothetical protein
MLPVNSELETVLNDFDSSDLINQVRNYNQDIQQSILIYLNTFGVIEKKAFLIAKKHLGTSFHIVRSTGYNEWNKSKK